MVYTVDVLQMFASYEQLQEHQELYDYFQYQCITGH